MKVKKMFLFLLIFQIMVNAQIKGKVIDEKNNSIAYVNIWVENESIGATSEENGEFLINLKDKNKKLIFSALGFEKRTITASDAEIVVLKATNYLIEEVVISKKQETKEIVIGRTDNPISMAFDNGPRIDVKYFPYKPEYKKVKHLKLVSIIADNRIELATIKIHFYKVDENGFPGDEMLLKDFVVNLKNGTRKSVFNIADFNLKMPLNGLFVGFEKLIIEKNKLENTIVDANTNTTKIQKTYFPFVLYNFVERDFLFTFSGGKWNRQSNTPNKIMVYEPSINLTLTN